MGRAKGELVFEGETLLARTVRRLVEATEAVVVVAGPEQEIGPLPPSVPVTILRDAAPFAGPLPAIILGLESLPASVDAAYVTGCDSPFLSSAWISFALARLRESDADAAWPRIGGQDHPLAGAYRPSAAVAARRLLEKGSAGPVRLADIAKVRLIREAECRSVDPGLAALFNVNTPEDWEKARNWRPSADRDEQAGRA